MSVLRSGRYRVLALDVDGTLLDAGGTLRPSTAEAVRRASRAGIRPVLCTGRRYRRARPVAEQLGLDAPLVCNSGALVKEPADHRTLWRADFDGALLAGVLAVFRDHDEAAVTFTDRAPGGFDFVVERMPTGRTLFDEYLELNRPHAEVDPGWTGRAAGGVHFHVCAIGSRPEMLEFERAVRARLGDRVQTFVQKSPRYQGTMCEVLRADASKWSGLLHLAEIWGVDASEICAVGDDMNDVPMLRGAGLGVAMGHAPIAVRDAADHVTADHDNDGVALLVDRVLLAWKGGRPFMAIDAGRWRKRAGDRGRVPYRFTSAQVWAMIEAGIIDGTGLGLWDGILYKFTEDELHNVIVMRTAHAFRGAIPRDGYYVREEKTSSDGTYSLPEPDVAVCRGTMRDAPPDPPSLDRLALVVEVDHHSARADGVVKFRRYAARGIPVYWIIKAKKRIVKVYETRQGSGKSARYTRSQTFSGRDEIPIVVDGRELGRVVAADLFPQNRPA